MKIKYFSLPNRFSSIFITFLFSLYVYAILLKEFRHSMVLGMSNTKVPEKYCRAPVPAKSEGLFTETISIKMTKKIYLPCSAS